MSLVSVAQGKNVLGLNVNIGVLGDLDLPSAFALFPVGDGGLLTIVFSILVKAVYGNLGAWFNNAVPRCLAYRIDPILFSSSFVSFRYDVVLISDLAELPHLEFIWVFDGLFDLPESVCANPTGHSKFFPVLSGSRCAFAA